MKLFVSSILVLGVVISHTHGAPNLLGSVLPRPPTKYDSKGLDLDSVDLDSLGNYDKDKSQSNYGSNYDQDTASSSTYDKKPSTYDKVPAASYDKAESLLNTGNLYDSLPLKTNNLYKKADLSELFGAYNHLHNLGAGNQLKSIYGTLGQTKGYLSPAYGLLEDTPLYGQGQDYSPSNFLYRLPTGQQLQCVVIN